MTSPYDEDYFLRGKETGKSLYDNYRWLPSLTVPMAKRIVEHCGIEKNDRILDFGCSRGYLVKALVELGFQQAWGVDVSEWAVKNCDETVRGRITLGHEPLSHYDWITAKDTLEHLHIYDLAATLSKFSKCAAKGVFIVVPLSTNVGETYVVPEYEQDVTHVIRWPLWRWVTEMYSAFDERWEICASYRIEGIKDNYSAWSRGNGFITLRRSSQG